MKTVENDWENSLNGPNSSKRLPNFPKMSQNFPKCPLQTQNTPNISTSIKYDIAINVVILGDRLGILHTLPS